MPKKRRRTSKSGMLADSKMSKSLKTGADFGVFKKFLILYITIILAGIPFVIGKYLEFNTPGPYDSASYVYSAQHISEGAKLGVDELASARPGTLLINFIGVRLFGFSETGPKIMQTIFQLLALAVMFIAARKLFGPAAACFSVFLASLYLSSPLIAKFGNVKEQFMAAFMIIAVSCFILSQLSGRNWWWTLAAGAAAINVYYFKQTGVSVIIAIIVFLIVRIAVDRSQWKSVLREIILLVTGGIIGILPLLIFFTWQGQLAKLMKTLPLFSVILLIQLMVFVTAVYLIILFARHFNIAGQLRKFKKARKSIWITGVCLIAVTLFSCMYYYKSLVIVDVKLEGDQVLKQLELAQAQNEMDYYGSLKKGDLALERGGELKYYFEDLVFIKYPVKLIRYPLAKIQSLTKEIDSLLQEALGTEGYIGLSRKHFDYKEQSKKVFRFYKALILPVSIAIASLIAALVIFVLRLKRIKKETAAADRMVILLGSWWIFDMLFVWISPRSYEQYYIPLTASAAMLGGYICFLFSAKLSAAKNKPPWLISGFIVIFVMSVMVWPIFAGQSKSPHTGAEYKQKRYGFAQSLQRVRDSKEGKTGPWEIVGKYIRERTNEDDTIYVWGWYPGIYVKSQRLSSAPKAFESEMHTKTPRSLGREVNRLLRAFKKNPPKYIVDSRKSHFPWNRPPLELWPTTSRGLLPNQKVVVARFDKDYSKELAEKIEPDEAARYEAMASFRKFVMDNYKIVEPKHYYKVNGQYYHKIFGTHRVFRLKEHSR